MSGNYLPLLSQFVSRLPWGYKYVQVSREHCTLLLAASKEKPSHEVQANLSLWGRVGPGPDRFHIGHSTGLQWNFAVLEELAAGVSGLLR